MSDAETRLHFRIGYLGDAFHGSQIQPDVRTVQGELILAFQNLDGFKSKKTSTIWFFQVVQMQESMFA